MSKQKFFLTLLFFIQMTLFFGQIKLVSLSGYVQLKYDEKSNWITPKAGDLLKTGYIIYTGFNSSAVIQINNSKIDVKPVTQISIAGLLSANNKEQTDLSLKYGNIKAEVNKNKETQIVFKVRSANSTASVRGTSFIFGDDELFVEKGTVQFLSDYGFDTLVQAGEKANVSKLSMSTTPMQNITSNASVNGNPSGYSDGESDGTQGGQERLPAKVLIKINVVF